MSLAPLLRNLLICILMFYIAPAWALQRVVIADFSLGVDSEGTPMGWQLKERSGRAKFSIVKEGDIHALRLRSEDASFSFQKPVDVDPLQYPVISWMWKVTKLPEGGDFRRPKTDDQAAQLFLAFSNRKAIVYLWDTNAPRGSVDDAWSPPFMTIKAIVLRSGIGDAGKWVTENRNVYGDYKKIFGHEPPRVAGIRIQINSQHTDTLGESFFADVVFKTH
ncbi:MAG: DUF3047 domain-containing protein [Pseudomonadota bacterium]